FQDQLALLLRERLELLPIGQAEFGNDRLGWQRRGIEDPGVRDQLQEAAQESFAQFAPPEFAQVTVPQQREQHFFLEDRFRRRRQADVLMAGRVEQGVRRRNVRQVEQLEKPIDRVAVGPAKRGRVARQETSVRRIQ